MTDYIRIATFHLPGQNCFIEQHGNEYYPVSFDDYSNEQLEFVFKDIITACLRRKHKAILDNFPEGATLRVYNFEKCDELMPVCLSPNATRFSETLRDPNYRGRIVQITDVVMSISEEIDDLHLPNLIVYGVQEPCVIPETVGTLRIEDARYNDYFDFVGNIEIDTCETIEIANPSRITKVPCGEHSTISDMFGCVDYENIEAISLHSLHGVPSEELMNEIREMTELTTISLWDDSQAYLAEDDPLTSVTHAKFNDNRDQKISDTIGWERFRRSFPNVNEITCSESFGCSFPDFITKVNSSLVEYPDVIVNKEPNESDCGRNLHFTHALPATITIEKDKKFEIIFVPTDQVNQISASVIADPWCRQEIDESFLPVVKFTMTSAKSARF